METMRTLVNMTGIVYDALKTKVFFAEDYNNVVANIKSGAVLHSQADASTITFDIDANGRLQTTTLAGNRTLAVTVTKNYFFTLIIKQDATGTRVPTWFSGILWAGGVAPTLTTTANKSDTFGFIRTGSGAYLGYVIGQNS